MGRVAAGAPSDRSLLGRLETHRTAFEILVAASCGALFVSSGSIYGLVSSPDLHAAFLPKHEHAWQALRELRLPLWSAFESCGAPLLGAGQGAMLYPPTIVLFALLPAHAALVAFYALHGFVLALAAQRYLRAIGLSAVAAALAPPIALAASFRGLPSSTVDHPSFVAAVAWFPVMLLCWERAATAAVDARRARLRWTGWFALAVAAQWLAGYPDFVFDTFILLGVAWLFAAPSERRTRLAILSAAVVIGTAIAAVQIVAIGEAVADGPRGELQELFAGMRTVLLRVRGLPSLMATPASVRLAGALVLAGLALLAPSRRRLAWLLSFLWGVLPLNAPFAWLYLLPPFSLSRFPLGWGYLGALHLGLLAAAGLETLLARPVRWVRAGGWLLAALATGQAVVVLATIPAGLVPALRFDEPMAARRAARLATLMEGIEPAPRLLSGPELRAGSLFRHRLRSAIGYEPSGGPPRWIFDLIKPVAVPSRPSSWGDWPQLGQHRDLAALLGVGLVVATPRGAERLRAAGFTDVAPLEGGDFVLQQPAVPRARIVHRARRASSDADSLEQTIAHAREAVVSAVVGPDASSLDLAEPPPGAREEARIVLDEPERVAIEAELAAPGLLVLTDTWVRGWSATVDGAEQPVLRVDHAFRGIALGPGHHRVVFLYRPRAIVAGAWLSFAALVLAVAMIGAGRGSRDS